MSVQECSVLESVKLVESGSSSLGFFIFLDVKKMQGVRMGVNQSLDRA